MYLDHTFGLIFAQRNRFTFWLK